MDLPEEIWWNILTFCEIGDIGSLFQINCDCLKVSKNDNFWKEIFFANLSQYSYAIEKLKTMKKKEQPKKNIKENHSYHKKVKEIIQKKHGQVVQEEPILVMDNGSAMSKSGFAGETYPRSVFPMIIGKPKFDITHVTGPSLQMNVKNCYIGDEPSSRGRPKLRYYSPIENGIITNWDGMEKMYHHIYYNELRRWPEEHVVLVTDTPSQPNPKSSREKITQIMFETFCSKGLCIANQGLLSLYGSGRLSGVVLQSGKDISFSVPIFEGKINHKSIQTMKYGGKDISTLLQKKINENGYNLTTKAEKEIIRDIKEKLCVVRSINTKLFEKNYQKTFEYELPDGTKLKLGKERFEAPELLFNPSVIQKKEKGIHEGVYESIQKCPKNNRKELMNNIVLAGGSTCFQGLSKRLNNEIRRLVVKGNKEEEHIEEQIKIIAPNDRKYLSWIGGSVFSSLSTFSNFVITNKEYNEYGPSIVHRRCIC